MPILTSEFHPAWWLRQAHLQTLWGGLARRPLKLEVRWERVELMDGDFIDLAWSAPASLATAPIVMLLHGLEGGIRSSYAKPLMQQLNRVGFRACLMHFRGCSGEPNRLPIAYHSGKTDDPQQIFDHLQATQGEVFGAIGISLGGNVLLKWIGEQAEQAGLQRAAALSVPFRLDDAARRLRGGFSRLYERHLVTSLQANYRRKFERMRSPLGELDVTQLNTFYRFDDQVTAPLHGFADVHDYYARASCRPFIRNIRIPTLIVHSRDDPFMFADTAPSADELSPSVTLELTAHGGHVGFIAGRWPGIADYWAERHLADWMAQPVTAD